jgi:hypothetical protein
MTDGGQLQQAGKALIRKFKKEEIADILVRIDLESALGDRSIASHKSN